MAQYDLDFKNCVSFASDGARKVYSNQFLAEFVKVELKQIRYRYFCDLKRIFDPRFVAFFL